MKISEEEKTTDIQIVEGELVENSKDLTRTEKKEISKGQRSKTKDQIPQSVIRNYLLLPFLFLTVTLLGGMRLDMPDNAFLFLKPALVCLIFASLLLVLFFRAGLIRLEGWFSESFSTVKNAANAAILLTLFMASVQIFNSLLPERGLPFWIVAFCFFWTLWNNLFAEFQTKRLLQSLGSLFGLAFIVKYIFLASLTVTGDATWSRRILETVLSEASFGLLDLPKFASGTGYIQFFTIVFYLLGLFLLSPTTAESERVKK